MLVVQLKQLCEISEGISSIFFDENILTLILDTISRKFFASLKQYLFSLPSLEMQERLKQTKVNHTLIFTLSEKKQPTNL